MVTIGKALSGGFYRCRRCSPAARSWRVPPRRPRQHVRRQPLGAAVGQAALSVLVEENMIENAAVMGEYFQDMLAEINSPHVKEVRGRG